MNTTELLQEPELTPILSAYFDTRNAANKALDACSWSLSLERSHSYDPELAATIADNILRMKERTALIAEALILSERFADFVALNVDETAAEYTSELYRYRQQQHDIADAPRRAWAAAYNARLAEIDKQIKGAKIRRGKAWGRWSKNEIDFATANALAAVIDGEIEALEARREIAAAERFESVAA
jgi:hypothetical protein